MARALLISVRFHDGRYHGSGEWPPSPARLFQALVAGAARGETLDALAMDALEWLEKLEPPVIAAPPVRSGQGYRTFVPNNDLDAVGGDPARIGEIRAAKVIRPRYFDVATPVLYAWTVEPDEAAERQAHAICALADKLYQLGRGVDMAWATGEVIDDADMRLTASGGVQWRPSHGGDGTALSCPGPGSLASLTRRFAAMRGRFRTVGTGRKASQLFAQAPKPDFRQVPYNSLSKPLLFEIRNDRGFAPRPLEHAVAVAETVRDLAVTRLKQSAWRRDDPGREALADRIFIGRDATDADKLQRLRITPLPSIGSPHADRAIRRVLVAFPPDCPIASGDVAWAFSGLELADAQTGELASDNASLVTADDQTMLGHYGIDSSPARLWRTVTPAALSERAARRRIDPARRRAEAKDGSERAAEEGRAAAAVRQALRHAGIDGPVESVRVQREPFDARGQLAEAFAQKSRFNKHGLWHVEVAFSEPVSGPVVIGDGRYLGLGLMRPTRRAGRAGLFAFAVKSGLRSDADPAGLARALRRAVMTRVQDVLGRRGDLPTFFSGHEPDGGSARSGHHRHLAFAWDAVQRRLLIVTPHLLDHRRPTPEERRHLDVLGRALDGFSELRAGAAGRLALAQIASGEGAETLLASSCAWESRTPYRVTRHVKLGDPAAAFESDLVAECLRCGLPRPQVEVIDIFSRPGLGLSGRAKLRFQTAIAGPLLLGRDRHFGGGLFSPC